MRGGNADCVADVGRALSGEPLMRPFVVNRWRNNSRMKPVAGLGLDERINKDER